MINQFLQTICIIFLISVIQSCEAKNKNVRYQSKISKQIAVLRAIPEYEDYRFKLLQKTNMWLESNIPTLQRESPNHAFFYLKQILDSLKAHNLDEFQDAMDDFIQVAISDIPRPVSLNNLAVDRAVDFKSVYEKALDSNISNKDKMVELFLVNNISNIADMCFFLEDIMYHELGFRNLHIGIAWGDSSSFNPFFMVPIDSSTSYLSSIINNKLVDSQILEFDKFYRKISEYYYEYDSLSVEENLNTFGELALLSIDKARTDNTLKVASKLFYYWRIKKGQKRLVLSRSPDDFSLFKVLILYSFAEYYYNSSSKKDSLYLKIREIDKEKESGIIDYANLHDLKKRTANFIDSSKIDSAVIYAKNVLMLSKEVKSKFIFMDVKRNEYFLKKLLTKKLIKSEFEDNINCKNIDSILAHKEPCEKKAQNIDMLVTQLNSNKVFPSFSAGLEDISRRIKFKIAIDSGDKMLEKTFPTPTVNKNSIDKKYLYKAINMYELALNALPKDNEFKQLEQLLSNKIRELKYYQKSLKSDRL
jgi:hypothetical protein